MKVVDNYITEENVSSHFEYIFSLKKVESPLTNFFTYDLDTQNTDGARPYVFYFYRLSKLPAKYNRGLTPYGLKKCKKDTIVLDGDNCVSNVLDSCLKLKGKGRRAKKNKILEYNLQLHAHNGRGFDTWIVKIDFPCCGRIVKTNQN